MDDSFSKRQTPAVDLEKKNFFEELVKIYDCLKSKFSHNSPENGSSWCPKSKLENGHEARDSWFL